MTKLEDSFSKEENHGQLVKQTNMSKPKRPPPLSDSKFRRHTLSSLNKRAIQAAHSPEPCMHHSIRKGGIDNGFNPPASKYKYLTQKPCVKFMSISTNEHFGSFKQMKPTLNINVTDYREKNYNWTVNAKSVKSEQSNLNAKKKQVSII
jgi:hypothetical protein